MALIFLSKMEVTKMAEQALSTIGVIFGWGLGKLNQAPSAFKQIEECISIGGVEVTQEK